MTTNSIQELYRLMYDLKERVAKLELRRDIQPTAPDMPIESVASWCITPTRRGNVEAIRTMTKFIERFLHFDDLGQQVDAKTRDDARVALGRSRVES